MKLQKIEIKGISLLKMAYGLFVGLFMISLTSCEDDAVGENGQEPVPVAYVSLYHASPAASPLDIIIDNTRLNQNPFEYTEYTGYLRFYTGEREFKFTPYNASNTLIEETVSLEDDMLYSVFVTGAQDDLQTVVVEDDIPEAESNNALVRVVHAAPDAPAIDLVAGEGEALSFENIAYRSASDFMEIPAGDTSFELMATGEDEVLASVSNVNFREGRVYTIVVRAPSSDTNDLSVQIVPNFFNF